MSGDILTAALAWQAAGASVVAECTDGTKSPLGTWKHRQDTPATAAEIRVQFANGSTDGVGLITGQVSGSLDMFEFEGRALAEGVHTAFLAELDRRGLLPLWQRITAGYSESTPSGGLHVCYRLSDGPVPGNTKLASRPETPAEMAAREMTANEKKNGEKRPRSVVLIETRGEGGHVIVAPSGGRTHDAGWPNGGSWTLLSGGPGSLAVITAAEREALYAVAQSLDQMPAPPPNRVGSGGQPVQPGTGAGRSWYDILTPAGYQHAGTDRQGHDLWTRPGKDGGTSATTSANGGFWVFSSSTEFETEVPYSKAAVIAVLEGGMDAAEALARFGTPAQATAAAEQAVEANLPPAPGAAPDGVEDDSQDGEHSPGHPFLDENEAKAWARTQSSRSFYDTDERGHPTLAAFRLAGGVATMGPLAMGTDNRMWAYDGGVYLPRPHVVRDRVALLLKDSYRRSHAATAEDVVAGGSAVLTSDPVEQYVNCRNGLLDWRAGTLKPHDPAVLSTVQLGTGWQPDARCPVFDEWLPQVVPDDCTGLVLDLIGYLAYSGNPLHTAVMLVGDGRNGKGTLLRVVKAILGPANVTAASLHDLINTRFTTASLFGKIACIAGDIDGTYLENTATLKAVTGGDLISAEHKNRDRFDFTPWAVPVFSANKIPASADTTAGYLSRWLIIPFPNSFEGREDRTVEAKLHAELPGILAAGLRRLPALLDRGQWELPGSAQEAKADFTRRVDQVRSWLHECCAMDPAGTLVNRTALYQAYRNWIIRDNGKALRASEFYSRLASAGVPPVVVRGVRGFKGIKVTDSCGMTGWYPP